MLCIFRAIQASLALYQRSSLTNDDDVASVENAEEDVVDSDLQVALMLSEQQRLEEEERRLQEQKTLEEILQLSLIDK